MIRIFDITLKDLMQLARDLKTFLFLLVMPVIFTLLFGFAFGGFSGAADPRLPVGYMNEDGRRVSQDLHALLAASDTIRLDENAFRSSAAMENLVADGKLPAAIIVPSGYTQTMLAGGNPKLILIGDITSPAGTTIEAEILATVLRLESSVRTATIMDELIGGRTPFDYALKQSLAAWKDPPIAVKEIASASIKPANAAVSSLAHTSPGMMLQFAIAGLLTAAQIIVTERKSRTLQRLLTTATRRIHILLGHFLAIFILIFSELILLILFGQILLKVDYLRVPSATLLVAFSSALCIAAMGLLIGILAKTAEQAIIFSLIPMFVFSGLGGAWVPLEVTSPAFQTIGHLSPIAWAMDGFQNVNLRGFGLESVLLPSGALAVYAVVFFVLAVWRLNASEEK
jgi:linearmycin/streptolysin S transport system permease protein